jgi:hypothetical protein
MRICRIFGVYLQKNTNTVENEKKHCVVVYYSTDWCVCGPRAGAWNEAVGTKNAAKQPNHKEKQPTGSHGVG